MHIALTTTSASLTLAGPKAAELRGWPGSVCVTYDDGEGKYLGARGAVRVLSYRLVGDGKHAPIVGTVERREGRFAIRTDDGHRFTLRGDGTQLTAAIGKHVWLLARWQRGALVPTNLGLLGEDASNS